MVLAASEVGLLETDMIHTGNLVVGELGGATVARGAASQMSCVLHRFWLIKQGAVPPDALQEAGQDLQ
jgi:hypothetical protein